MNIRWMHNSSDEEKNSNRFKGGPIRNSLFAQFINEISISKKNNKKY